MSSSASTWLAHMLPCSMNTRPRRRGTSTTSPRAWTTSARARCLHDQQVREPDLRPHGRRGRHRRRPRGGVVGNGGGQHGLHRVPRRRERRLCAEHQGRQRELQRQLLLRPQRGRRRPLRGLQ